MNLQVEHWYGDTLWYVMCEWMFVVISCRRTLWMSFGLHGTTVCLAADKMVSTLVLIKQNYVIWPGSTRLVHNIIDASIDWVVLLYLLARVSGFYCCKTDQCVAICWPFMILLLEMWNHQPELMWRNTLFSLFIYHCVLYLRIY